MVLLSTTRARSIVSDGSRMCACSSSVSKHADNGRAMGVVEQLVEMSRTMMHAASSRAIQLIALPLIRLARKLDFLHLGGR